MENQAHGSSYYHRKTRLASRMEQDLLSSHHNGTSALHPSEDGMLRRLLPVGRVPHICVVGAGMAGLRCADLLSKAGVKVTLLEARNRIGGRVRTSKASRCLG